MTSNLESSMLRQTFRPEFLNRIDEIVTFSELSKENIKAIVGLQLERVQSRLNDRKIKLNFDDSAMDFLCEKGYDPAMGARPVKRAIQNYVENALAKELLSGNIAEGSTVRITSGNDGLIMR
jgi:ATP-dependent Clp protease ATP-binding subunit ClpB